MFAHCGSALEDPLVSAMLFDDEAASLLERAYATTDMVSSARHRESRFAHPAANLFSISLGPWVPRL